MLINLKSLFETYISKSQAVAAFNVGNIEMIKAVFDTVKIEKKPVVIQVFWRVFEEGTGAYLAEAIKFAANKIDLPIVLQLDHCINMSQLAEAIELGFTSLMVDGSALNFEDNISMIFDAKKLIRSYKKEGEISIEAELGGIPVASIEMEKQDFSFTDKEEAVRFSKLTKVDALAISYGSAHGIYKRKPELNFELLKNISGSIDTPLVLHGGTGLSDGDIRTSIKFGIKKVNISTELQKYYIDKIKEESLKNNGNYIPLDILLKPVKEGLKDIVSSKIKLIESIQY
ncbi:MAG: class II fructose-bisphosphate aldolase [Candidatus Humimicrobiaceae bacterium]